MGMTVPKLLTLFVGATAMGFVCFRCLSTHPAQIQTDLGNKAVAALQSAAFGWAEVSVDGRDLTLSGIAPDAATRISASHLMSQIAGLRRVSNTLSLAPAPTPAGGHPADRRQ